MSEQVASTPNTPENPEGATPQQQQPAGQSASPAAAQSPARSFSQEDLNSFLAGERRRWQESQEIRDLRAKAKRAEELEAAQLTETERLTRRAAEAEAKAQELEGRYRDALIRARFTTEALAAGVRPDRVEQAYRLADLSGVTVDADGTVVIGAAVLEAIVPEWRTAAAAPAPTKPAFPLGGERGNGAQQAPMTREQRIAQTMAEMRASGRYSRL